MGDSQGFDNMFNDGLFRTGLHTSIRARPPMWPAAVTEMRKHTFYGGQGMSSNHDVGYSTYVTKRPYVAQQSRRPTKWSWSDATRSRFLAADMSESRRG